MPSVRAFSCKEYSDACRLRHAAQTSQSIESFERRGIQLARWCIENHQIHKLHQMIGQWLELAELELRADMLDGRIDRATVHRR